MYIEALHKRIIARHLSGKAGLEPLNTDSMAAMVPGQAPWPKQIQIPSAPPELQQGIQWSPTDWGKNAEDFYGQYTSEAPEA